VGQGRVGRTGANNDGPRRGRRGGTGAEPRAKQGGRLRVIDEGA